MARIRHTDADEGWINRKFQEIDRAIRELRSAKRVLSEVVVRANNGDAFFTVGDMPLGDKGVAILRDNASTAMVVRRKNPGDTEQAWSLFDAAGNEIVAELQFLRGLGKPYLEHPFQPVSATTGTAVTCGPYGWERSTSSASWTTLFAYDGKRQNGFIDLKVAVWCSDATTAGEVRVVNEATGTVLPSFGGGSWTGSVVAGTTTPTILDPTAGQIQTTEFAVHTQMRLGLQVRVTAGTGSITLAVAQAIGGG